MALEAVKGNNQLMKTLNEQFGAQALERIKQGALKSQFSPLTGDLIITSEDGSRTFAIPAASWQSANKSAPGLQIMKPQLPG